MNPILLDITKKNDFIKKCPLSVNYSNQSINELINANNFYLINSRIQNHLDSLEIAWDNTNNNFELIFLHEKTNHIMLNMAAVINLPMLSNKIKSKYFSDYVFNLLKKYHEGQYNVNNRYFHEKSKDYTTNTNNILKCFIKNTYLEQN
jgi:hypothetical protein